MSKCHGGDHTKESNLNILVWCLCPVHGKNYGKTSHTYSRIHLGNGWTSGNVFTSSNHTSVSGQNLDQLLGSKQTTPVANPSLPPTRDETRRLKKKLYTSIMKSRITSAMNLKKPARKCPPRGGQGNFACGSSIRKEPHLIHSGICFIDIKVGKHGSEYIC